MQSNEHGPEERAVLRLDPEKRLCPLFNELSLAPPELLYDGGPENRVDTMGFRVQDNCCEEHQM